MPEQLTIPDSKEIRRDLEYMTARWSELSEPAQFEIRAFKEDCQSQSALFTPARIEEAVDWAEEMNERGYNIYAVRNPIRMTVSRNATDNDIIASFFLWADCDEPQAAENVQRFDGPRWSAAVITGTVPSVRAHTYWMLEQPCTDMTEWRHMQAQIARHFGSDGSVINPSRIMRVGGTVSYPFKRKVERGYQKEVTVLRTKYDDERPPVTLEQMRRVFGRSGQQALSIAATPYAPPLDRERTAIQALSGVEWNNAVLRLVGSYVRKGLSDGEIHALTDPLTLPGYTVEQTRAEVQDMINRTRTNPKFEGAGQEYPTPAFEPQAEAPEQGAPSDLEWFEDIEAALGGAYLIKGLLDEGAMSVIYGPSNSGKTFFALDLVYHIAGGIEWRGRRVTQGSVLYLAAEGGRGVLNRIVALKMEHNAKSLPLAVKRAGLDLLRAEADLQTIYRLSRAVQEAARDMPHIIVIDTLSRVMAGGDENSAADMTALIRNIDAIRAATGAHIMLVHHTGKDAARGARGHSSLRAATDTEIEVQNEEGERAAQVQKQREHEGNETFAFSLKAVTLGTDQDGDEVTSCIVEVADSEEFVESRKARRGVGGNQRIVMDAFDQLVGEGMAQPNPGGVGMPEAGKFWAVKLEDLRTHAMGKFDSNNPRDAWRTAWKGVSEGRGLFCVASGLCWRTDRRVK